MPRYFLTRVRIEGFRGINNESDPLELKFKSGAVNSVFAINGVGKSSIYEALCYAIRGTVPKLKKLQAQEEPDTYIANRFHSKGVATVELDLEPDDGSPLVTVQVTRSAAGIRAVTSPTNHRNPVALLSSLDQDFTLLDYSTFSDFIDATPLERGRSFSTLLGLSSYSYFRQGLQVASDKRNVTADLKLAALRANKSNYEQAAQTAMRRLQAAYHGLIGKPFTDTSKLEVYVADVVSALRDVELLKPHVSGESLADMDFEALSGVVKTAEGGDQRHELATLIAKLTELEGIGAPDAEGAGEQAALMDLVSERDRLLGSTRGVEFKKLYDAANEILNAKLWDRSHHCLLCESELKASIESVVTLRLSQYDQVTQQNRQISEACSTAGWIRRLRAIETSKALGIPEENRAETPLISAVSVNALTAAHVKTATTALGTLETQRADAIAAFKKRKAQLEKELPPSLVALTEQIQYVLQFRDALTDYRANEANASSEGKTLDVRERWQAFVTKAESIFSAAEGDLSRQTISSIESEYKTLFKRVMAVSDVVPLLQRDASKEDLQVQLEDFHGLKDLSARALLSESFRNALAISVFLSAATKQSSNPRFVVLDDVTSSFDSGHQWNLMEAIRLTLQQPTNAAGLQFIVLSHDGLLEKYFDKLGNSTNWHHQRLQGMPPMGAVMTHVQDANRLRQTAKRLLNAGQVREAEPLIRQYLEFKLLQLIGKVQIPVPLDFAIKDHHKMVSNCLDAINAAIRLHTAASSLVLTAAQQNDLSAVHVPALVGNWVSHYETAAGGSLAPAVLLGILQTIDDYAECFRWNDTSGPQPVRKWYRNLSSR